MSETDKDKGSRVLGIVAGQGEMPALMAVEAQRQGYEIVVASLQDMADSDLSAYSDTIKTINIGKIGGIIKFLKQHGAAQVLFAGKVLKIRLYEGKVRPDLKAVAMFIKARDRRDDSLMDTLSDMFEEEDIKVADMRKFCSSLIVEEGQVAGKKPSKQAMKDVAFGFRMAKGIGELDIGQTVVVKDRNVVAVEAIEGTDKAIIRGGELAGDGSVVVKVFRPKQNARYDLPAAGIATLRAMDRVGANVLALEAGLSIIIDREAFSKEAKSLGISVLGVSAESLAD